MSAAALLCVAALGFRIQEPESGEEGRALSETATPFPPPFASVATSGMRQQLLLALAWQFVMQEAIKIFLLTFVSPQFAAKMPCPRAAFVQPHGTHQVPTAILGVLRNVIA